MFTIESTANQIHTVTEKDPVFTIYNGLTVCNRASLQITPECPSSAIFILHQALDKGWIRLASHMTEEEYLLAKLRG